VRERSTYSTFGTIVLFASIGAMLAIIWLYASIFISARPIEPTVQPPAISVVNAQPATENVPGALLLVNQYRSTKHLSYLALNTKLESSAQAKADDLVAQNYWAHTRPGKTPWDFFNTVGYDYQRAGENLAKCWTSTNAIVEAWINSPTHQAVLVGDYEDVGFGIAHSSRDDCNYVVAHFGTEQVAEDKLPVTGVSQ